MSLAVSGSKLFAGTNGGGIRTSSDDGKNWRLVNTGQIDLIINCLAINMGNLYAGTSSGILKSTDYGSNWIYVGSSLLILSANSLAQVGTYFLKEMELVLTGLLTAENLRLLQAYTNNISVQFF